MGESKLKLARREEMLLSCAGVQTMAGRVQVRWESESAATPMGQLAYFIEFLNLTGLWRRWLESCPLSYASPNAPSKAEVLGTWMLSALSGHRRYAHVTGIRCDGVNPGLLGMNKVISEDALRNALKRIPEGEGCAWLDGHLSDSVAPLLEVHLPIFLGDALHVGIAQRAHEAAALFERRERVDVNAIQLPSGDQDGDHPAETSDGVPPDPGTTQICELPPSGKLT